MGFRVSFAYRQQEDRLAGWTENFWINSDDYVFAEPKVRNLYGLLDQLHGDQSVVPFARLSSTLNKVRVKPIKFGDFDIGVPDAANVSDHPTTALLLVLEGEGGYITRQWLKGIPDDQVKRGGKMTLTADYQAKFSMFRAALLDPAELWSVRVLDRTKLEKEIDGLSEPGVVTVQANDIPDGAKVRISRVGSPSYAEGVWKVKKDGPDFLQLRGYKPQTGIAWSGKGVIRELKPIFLKIVNASLEMATSHKVGRPLGLRGGRRKKRKTPQVGTVAAL